MINTQSLSLTLDEKEKIVSKVRKSKIFANAPTSSALLAYLSESTLENRELKESIIEIDFFGDKRSAGKNNPRVRVNVYNLRKKLIQYYESEGNTDDWIIEIAKGQYAISFHKKEERTTQDSTSETLRKYKPKHLNKTPKKRSYLHTSLLYSIIIGLLAYIIYLLYPVQRSYIWKEFYNPEKPITLYIGDAYGFMGRTASGNYGWNRDYSINSEADLKKYMINDSNYWDRIETSNYNYMTNNSNYWDRIETSNYNYMTRMGAYGSQALSIYLNKFEKKVQIQFATETEMSELGNSNAIYIGPTQTKPIFLHLFNSNNPFLKIEDKKLYLSNYPAMNDTVIQFNGMAGNQEYAIVSKINGPKQTKTIMFLSNHDMGVTKLVDFFTTPDSLQYFEEKHNLLNENFTALFKVKGFSRTATSSECLFVVRE